METANYLHNRLPTWSQAYGELIEKEYWTGRKQDLRHICIFRSLVLCNIPKEKKTKSDYWKVWEGILIGYNANIAKHFHIWVPQTNQVVIASELYIDKSKQDAKLLVKFLLNTIKMISAKRRALARELRSRRSLQKNLIIKEVIPPAEEDIEEVGNKKQVEVAISLTETSSKIYELQLYDKVINNPIHRRHWRKTIKDELQNLENH